MPAHTFDVDLAVKYGVNCAIILQHIHYWMRYNETNGTNFHDGNYWTYNSVKAFHEMFPYMSEKQIRGALKKLIDAGLVIVGNYNKLGFDRTQWYTLSELGKSVITNGKMPLYEKSNEICTKGKMRNVQKGEPIPDIIPNNKPNINTNNIYSQVVDYLNEKAETRYNSKTAKTQSLIRARQNEGYTLEDFKKVIDNKVTEWQGTEWEKFLRPETLFGTKFENYLNQKVDKKPEKDEFQKENDRLMEIMFPG